MSFLQPVYVAGSEQGSWRRLRGVARGERVNVSLRMPSPVAKAAGARRVQHWPPNGLRRAPLCSQNATVSWHKAVETSRCLRVRAHHPRFQPWVPTPKRRAAPQPSPTDRLGATAAARARLLGAMAVCMDAGAAWSSRPPGGRCRANCSTYRSPTALLWGAGVCLKHESELPARARLGGATPVRQLTRLLYGVFCNHLLSSSAAAARAATQATVGRLGEQSMRAGRCRGGRKGGLQ